MQTTYTIKTKMPLPTVGVAEQPRVSWCAGVFTNVIINTVKTTEWLEAVKNLISHPSVLFGTMIDGSVMVSLTDKDVAAAFEAKWGREA